MGLEGQSVGNVDDGASTPAGQTKRQEENPQAVEWKQEQASWEENRDVAQLHKNGVRKAKVQIELNLARDTKHNKDFYKYASQKRKVKESACSK